MVNRILRFTWDEWKWLTIVVMLGIVMYWTAIVIEPTNILVQEARDTQEQITNQQKVIISNQNNNTKNLERVFHAAGDILRNQSKLNIEVAQYFLDLQKQHENTTQILKTTQEQSLAISKNIAQLTNDIYIMQKAELENRKSLGKFLAYVANQNNVTIPEELQSALLFEDVTPQASSPH